MEIFKEMEFLGKNFIKAKKGVRLTKEEAEESKKFVANTLKIINKTANFVNENQLTEPILSGLYSTYKTILIICIILVILSILTLLLLKDIVVDLLLLLFVGFIAKGLLIVSSICLIVLFFLFYSKLREKIKKI